jgi:hypothetical protein
MYEMATGIFGKKYFDPNKRRDWGYNLGYLESFFEWFKTLHSLLPAV